jgi:hypothetical protein
MYFQPEPLRTHAPSVPEPLDRLIESLLRKDPAMRPATAGDVVAALEHCRTSGRMPVVDEPSAPVPAAAVPAVVPVALVPAAPLPAAVPAPLNAFERRSGGVSTTLGGAAGAVSRDVLVIAGRRGARRIVWLAGAALAAAAGIAITARWPRAATPAGTPALPESGETVPNSMRSTEVVAPPDAAVLPQPPAAVPPPPAAPAPGAAPSVPPPPTSPPRAAAPAAPAAAPTAPARTPATRPRKLDRARPAAPVVPAAPEPQPRSEEEILTPRR